MTFLNSPSQRQSSSLNIINGVWQLYEFQGRLINYLSLPVICKPVQFASYYRQMVMNKFILWDLSFHCLIYIYIYIYMIPTPGGALSHNVKLLQWTDYWVAIKRIYVNYRIYVNKENMLKSVNLRWVCWWLCSKISIWR